MVKTYTFMYNFYSQKRSDFVTARVNKISDRLLTGLQKLGANI